LYLSFPVGPTCESYFPFVFKESHQWLVVAGSHPPRSLFCKVVQQILEVQHCQGYEVWTSDYLAESCRYAL
jgi:hypothetical protein